MFKTKCPVCENEFEISSDDLGQTVACQCGTQLVLRDADVAPPGEIHVTCPACAETYEVEAEDAGEEMECECGTDVRVPYIVVARRVKKKLKKKVKPQAEPVQPGSVEAKPARKPKSVPQPQIQVDPDAAQAQTTSAKRQRRKQSTKPESQKSRSSGTAAQREAGKKQASRRSQPTRTTAPVKTPQRDWRSNAVSLTRNKEMQAKPPSSWQPLEAQSVPLVEDLQTSEPAKDQAATKPDRAASRAKREKPTPWLEIISAAAIGLFVLGSVLAFVFRGSGSVAQRSPDASDQPASEAATSETPAQIGQMSDGSAVESGGIGTPKSEQAPSDSRQPTSKKFGSPKGILTKAGGNAFLLGGDGTGELESIEKARRENSNSTAPQASERLTTLRSDGNGVLSYPAIPISKIIAPPHDETITDHEPKKRSRALVPPIEAAEKYLNFERAYQRAYEAYQTYQGMKKESTDNPERQEALGQAIGRFLYCRSVIDDDVSEEQQNQILYTLANLYLDAGHLYEAAVFANHLVVHAKPKDPTAEASAMIVLVAMQEAHQTQFGDKDSPGELRQIAWLADQIQSRWPDHPKLDLIRYVNAQTLESEGFMVEAASEFAKVSDASEFYGRAQLAAGRGLWAVALAKEKINPKDAQIQGIISTAAQHLDRGIKVIENDGNPTATLLAAKLARAQIYLRRENPDAAASQLGGGEKAVTRLAGKRVKVSDDFITLAYETLFAAYVQTGDVQKVQTTLGLLAKRYGPEGKTKITKLYTNLASDFVDGLPTESAITSQQLDRLESIIASITKGKRRTPLQTKLWIAQTWASLAPRAASAADTKRCLENSNMQFSDLLSDSTIEPGMRLSIQLKLIEAYQVSGQFDQALDTIGEILTDKPNAIDVQFQAARLLREQALTAPSVETYAAAITGREGSAIWGWQKLCKTLMSLHFASDGSTKYADRMLEAIYHSNEMRLAKARLPLASAERAGLLKAASSQLKQAGATLVSEDSPWRDKLLDLEEQIAAMR